MRRVVVTGLGILSSIGEGTMQTWDNLLACKSGIKKITFFNTDDLSSKIAGYISNNEKYENYININKYLDNKEIKRNDRFIQYGLVASSFAIKDANLDELSDEQKLRTGVSVGSGIGGLETIYNGSVTLVDRGPRKISPFFIPSSLINLLSGQISIKHGF